MINNNYKINKYGYNWYGINLKMLWIINLNMNDLYKR